MGILQRNDGECHLNGTQGGAGYYTHSTLLDYPSVSQIGAAARTSSFSVIFAVTPQYRDIWQALSDLVTGSYVQILEKDASNIVDLIEDMSDNAWTSLNSRIIVAVFSQLSCC